MCDKESLLRTHWPLVGERVLPPPPASVAIGGGEWVVGPASVALGVGSGEGPLTDSSPRLAGRVVLDKSINLSEPQSP